MIQKVLYKKIAEELTLDICSGRYKLGEKLDSVRKLADEKGVNQNTLLRALRELERKGLVVVQRTTGYFVTTQVCVVIEEKERLLKLYSANYQRVMKRIGVNEEYVINLIKRNGRKYNVGQIFKTII